MQRFLSLFFISLTLIAFTPLDALAGGYAPGEEPIRKRRARKAYQKQALVPPPPSCVARSKQPKIRIVSYNPKQRAEKIMGAITECATNQWDVLRILGGPNIIGLDYPSEKEQWGYVALWGHDLHNPAERSVILMDKIGKRIKKGKNPVELYITFNSKDVVEKVEMKLNTKHRKGAHTYSYYSPSY